MVLSLGYSVITLSESRVSSSKGSLFGQKERDCVRKRGQRRKERRRREGKWGKEAWDKGKKIKKARRQKLRLLKVMRK